MSNRRNLAILLATTSALCFAIGSGPARAADILPVGSEWTGWHVGIGAGYGMANHEIDLDIVAPPISASFSGIGAEGMLASIEAGYDWKFNESWLIGAQLDYTFSNIATTADLSLGAGGLSYELQARHAISALVRVGHLVNDSTLLYSIGGYTRTNWYGDPDLPAPLDGNNSFHTDGLTLGGGIEHAIADNITMKLEYRYTMNAERDILDLGPIGDLTANTNMHTARMVLSYRPGVYASAMDGSEEQWTGLRVGLGAGYSMINHELALDAPPLSADLSGIGGEGFLGGVELGADMLVGERFVIGAQAGYTYSNASTDLDVTGLGPNLGYELEATHSFDVLARAGILTGPDVLWYGIAGWTRTQFQGDVSIPGLDSYKYSVDGLTVGAGAEVMLTDNLSWKTEYRYTDFESNNIISAGGFSLDGLSNVQTVRTVMTWHF